MPPKASAAPGGAKAQAKASAASGKKPVKAGQDKLSADERKVYEACAGQEDVSSAHKPEQPNSRLTTCRGCSMSFSKASSPTRLLVSLPSTRCSGVCAFSILLTPRHSASDLASWLCRAWSVPRVGPTGGRSSIL